MAQPAESRPGRRVALLVATAEYIDQSLRRLRAPTEDARLLRELLLDPNVGGFDEVVIVANESKSGVERELERLFRERAPEDMVLLYLTGHGVKNDYNQLFFATANTDLTRPYSTAVPAVVLQHLVTECQARAKVVLLDCCFSGAFTAGQVQMSGNAVDLDEHLGRGVYVITATNELEYAYEREQLIFDKPQRNSVFTAAVIRALQTGAADLDGDGEISVSELYKYVYDDLRAERVQTPTQSGKLEGHIRIAKARSGRITVGDQQSAPIVGDLLATADTRAALPAPLGVTHLVDRHLGTEVHMDLGGHVRHLAIVGRISSGKSTLIRTLVVGLTAIRDEREVQFYCLDGDGRLNSLGALPHVRALHGTFDPEQPRRLLQHVRSIVDQRRKLFQQMRIPDETTFRLARKRAGILPPGEHADIFLVVDGWEALAEDLPMLADEVKYIAGRGGSFGVHVILSARQWAEIPAKVLSLVRGRIELALDDPAESKIDAALAATLPDDPGWALHADRRFHVALPQLTADADDLELVLAGLRDGTLPSADDDALPWSLPQPVKPDFLRLLGITSLAEYDVRQGWRPRPARERFRIPFGVDQEGRPVELDLKESAMDGMGPHGLCIGATGSGKSEFMRTLVLGLAATHSPANLNFVLVDFKGGATFHGLDALPHVSATITNLQGDLTLVDRMKDALLGEMNRRQELLRAAGNFKNVWEYERARETNVDHVPLPALFIVVDEFSELLSAKPDFIDLFIAIGRLGRSLQMHMLLATQRLEEGKLRGLDSHLSYRIGLRTFSASESRAAIGVPDAYELPSIPGTGYLKFGTEAMTRFTAAYVSGPQTDADTSSPGGGQPLLTEVVRKLAGHGPPAHEVWLPPLDLPDPLDTLLPPLQATEDRGLCSPQFPANGRLRAPVGFVDRPFEQRRDLLWADFSGARGNAAIVGGPQSGKSTLVRTLVMAMALTHTPREVQFYCLDLGGGSLKSLAGLPHVGTVAGRMDHDVARRMIAEITLLITARERLFAEWGIDSMAEFRDRKRAGEFTEDPFGDVFLIVDGWLGFRQEFEALETQVVNLVAVGLSYGVHVVVAANRWAEIRPAVKDLLGSRFELRLGDPSESDIDRRAAVNVPAGRPGRGLTHDKLHFLVALPRIDGSSALVDVGEGVQHATRRVQQCWSGPTASPVRLLPDLMSYDDLLKQDRHRGTRKIPIGVNEDQLAPVYLDFDAEPHFLAFADGESGKTNLLRTIVRGIMERYSEDEVVVLIVDYRRTMLNFMTTGHLLGYAVAPNQLNEMLKDVIESLTKRLPGRDITQEQLKHRSWWSGPELFVIVDDYDLVATSSGNPLLPLQEFLPQAKDVGLHMIVTRRSGGASRALFDPIVGRLKELASPGLVMSGNRDEGVLLGNYRPTPLPPGRGALVTRKSGQQVIHVAWTDPEFVTTTKTWQAQLQELDTALAEGKISAADYRARRDQLLHGATAQETRGQR
ncbi:S-DNA-T family DNA segregation ATPase FtsK/SpoIIIE [Kibdelosporangium banguiense]|uniref:S-DNA-T family DNA segregation ATPase FtsK/SpoIIIE n=1 Tax=Kibdelosporangium banguiense TaxID=1365924 RepID=A0ABS4TMM7_9PSEU|nr:S-DNA-T family DNA segregation ATPase FtsK/SpoIIIE [Kibdelosporangium banguiense]